MHPPALLPPTFSPYGAVKDVQIVKKEKVMCKDPNCMCYDDHSECAARIAELEQQLAAMTAERDSESRWAKKYSDEADELRQQLAAAQENTLGPWFLTQGLCTLDAIADHIITLQRQLAAAQERNTKLQSEHLDHVNALHEQLTAANAEIERLSAELSPLGLPAPFILRQTDNTKEERDGTIQ